MGQSDIAVSGLGMMDGKAEKEVLEDARRYRISIWRSSKSTVYHKIVVALAIVILLLWQYGLPLYARLPFRTRRVQGIPNFVLKYAPMVWLDEQEQYFPSDIYAQVANTYPAVNRTSISDPPSPLTLDNLDLLNIFGDNGMDVFLTSNVDVEEEPKWLDGVVPDSDGKTANAVSSAIIVNDHGNGSVDAFYMYFYAYNRGNTVLFQELGDHIGDWEHNMIRFKDGKPQELWFSQHGNGEAFKYDAVEKMGRRPVAYSARGSHATYATQGTHDHTIPDLNLPIGPLQDHCSQGMLWDPTLSAYFYTFNATTFSFRNADGRSPIGAMYYNGRWGDEQYPMSDERQKEFFGFKKYVGGPTGPWDKQLQRKDVCPSNGIPCIVRSTLGP